MHSVLSLATCQDKYRSSMSKYNIIQSFKLSLDISNIRSSLKTNIIMCIKIYNLIKEKKSDDRNQKISILKGYLRR